jgi:hypothetical protein
LIGMGAGGPSGWGNDWWLVGAVTVSVCETAGRGRRSCNCRCIRNGRVRRVQDRPTDFWWSGVRGVRDRPTDSLLIVRDPRRRLSKTAESRCRLSIAVEAYMVNTVRYVLYPLYPDCIRPRSRYSEIQYMVYPLYPGPDTVDTVCISPWSRYGGYVLTM